MADCIQHKRHCHTCKRGVGEYEEYDLNTYSKTENEQARFEYMCEIGAEEAFVRKPGACTDCGEVPEKATPCVSAPELSEEFKALAALMDENRRRCPAHDWHCGVCGKGINGPEDGERYDVLYSWAEAQEVAYPETDHFRCNDCDRASVGRLPHQQSDWKRKQAYLDFLTERRRGADRTSCK